MHVVRIYSQDIGMESGMEKCAMLVIKSSKHDGQNESTKSRKKLERSEKRKRTNTWGYWKLTPPNTRKLKKPLKKEYLRRLLVTKHHSKNLVKGINTWAVPLVRYQGPFLK